MIATRNSSTRNLIETIANELKQADKVLIGAGAGLSAADGFEYGGAWFQEHFGDFVAAYGLTDAYTAGFYPSRTKPKNGRTGAATSTTTATSKNPGRYTRTY